MHPTVRILLRNLGQLGARATATAVDTVLEEGEHLLAEASERLKAGRRTAQTIGRPKAKKAKAPRVKVDVQPMTDQRGETIDAEIVDDDDDTDDTDDTDDGDI